MSNFVLMRIAFCRGVPWTGLAHFASISCIQFFSPGSWYLFCDTRSQMKGWRFSVYRRFVFVFLAVFNYYFFYHRKISILR